MLKKYSTYVAVLLVIVVIGIGIAIDITNRWNNSKYWTYENVLSTTKNTPATVIRETTDEVEIKFDYGLLHSIQEEGDKIKLSFSYEPYDIYQLRGKDNKNLGTDLSFVIDSKSDSKPSAFLGRLDKSFDSVKALGTYSVVETSGEVKFNYTKPKMELGSLWSHYVKAISGKKSDYDVKITSWYVEDISKLAEKTLSNLTEDKKKDLRKKWREETEKYLVEYHGEEELLSSKYEGKYFLAELKRRFLYQNLVCTEESGSLSCEDGYLGSSGLNVMTYMYVRNNSGKTAFNDKFLKAARESLFPFTERINESTFKSEWLFMNTNGFSICPIVEVVKRDYSSNNVKLFMEHYEEFYTRSANRNLSSKELVEKVKAIDRTRISSGTRGIISLEDEHVVNDACYRAILTKTDSALISELNSFYKRVFDSFFSIRAIENSSSVIKRITMDEYIARSTSVYGNRLLTDYILLDSRLGSIDNQNDQIAEKLDIKMLLKTYIIMYIYGLYE